MRLKSLRGTENVSLGEIILTQNVIELNEASVQGSRIINKGNVMLVFPEKKILDGSSGFLDFLQKMSIPGLYVDPISQTIQIDNKSKICE
jgi:hypothetical protein